MATINKTIKTKKVIKKVDKIVTHKKEIIKPITEEVKKAPKKVKAGEYFFAVGRRKTSVATVRIYPNDSGEAMINEKPFKTYFADWYLQEISLAPFVKTNQKEVKIVAKINGGGKKGQAEALRHAISRALIKYDEDLRSTLKKAGFLTRDSRMKERKKYGLKAARRAPQWSKR